MRKCKWIGPLGALSLLAFGCAPTPVDPPASVQATTVTVVHPEHGDITRMITLPGDLVGYYEAALHAKVSGYLKSISVDKGDTIKAGEVLAEIEVPELQQKLIRARANLEVRHLTYERLKKVWDSDPRLVAREDVDIANSEYEEAKADVEELEALVSYTRIVAPFDGVVTGRYVDPGALIEAGGPQSSAQTESAAAPRVGAPPVVTVADINKLRVYVYVPEGETGRIRVGMPATLKLREFHGRVFKGTVTRFAKALDLSTRTMLTEVDLENPHDELYPGMYANVTLELERHPNALQVPNTAVGADKNRSVVYVVAEDRLRQVPVTTGLSNASNVEIVHGLAGTEQVVEHFSPTLSVGQKVRPVLVGDNDGLALAGITSPNS